MKLRFPGCGLPNINKEKVSTTVICLAEACCTYYDTYRQFWQVWQQETQDVQVIRAADREAELLQVRRVSN